MQKKKKFTTNVLKKFRFLNLGPIKVAVSPWNGRAVVAFTPFHR